MNDIPAPTYFVDDEPDMLHAPAIANIMRTLSRCMTGLDVTPDHCAGCGKTMDMLHLDREFTDALSRKEWGISHLCQACQDEAFKEDDDEMYDGPSDDEPDFDDGHTGEDIRGGYLP